MSRLSDLLSTQIFTRKAVNGYRNFTWVNKSTTKNPLSLHYLPNHNLVNPPGYLNSRDHQAAGRSRKSSYEGLIKKPGDEPPSPGKHEANGCVGRNFNGTILSLPSYLDKGAWLFLVPT